ncbi:MAG: hypothetical protein ACKO6G_01450 [Vulcanococcus sp.]
MKALRRAGIASGFQVAAMPLACSSRAPDDRTRALEVALMVADMESEKRWGELFAASQDVLSALAHQALLEHENRQSERQSRITDIGHNPGFPAG